MEKKLQIFISSTYTDLLKERQIAVQTILEAGHIPAGMELFSAGNKSQLEIIKKWIDESDVYVLILGGRYGSIEPDSGKSYTEIEYRYAVEKEKPFFAIVLDEEMIEQKVKDNNSSFIERENYAKHKEFEQLVKSKICKICKTEAEIKSSILLSIIDIEKENKNLIGWVRGNAIQFKTVPQPNRTRLPKRNKDVQLYDLYYETELQIRNATVECLLKCPNIKDIPSKKELESYNKNDLREFANLHKINYPKKAYHKFPLIISIPSENDPQWKKINFINAIQETKRELHEFKQSQLNL